MAMTCASPNTMSGGSEKFCTVESMLSFPVIGNNDSELFSDIGNIGMVLSSVTISTDEEEFIIVLFI